MLTGGCTSLSEYLQNGLKVGPNYGRPPAPVAREWIDATDKRVRSDTEDLSAWYTVFKDPVLDSLICSAYQQNLTLREAGSRVLQARAQLAIAAGSFFPQTQDMTADYTRNAVSTRVANHSNVSSQFFNQWDYGFHLAWELDFWGRFRRAIESASASLDASVEDYDGVLVTLLGDVANNQLCILLGIPPEELEPKLGSAPIPTAPTEVAAGIPADLLRRRPDVRRAERQAAAQSAQIGVAEAELYPHISITGTINYST